MQIFCDCAALFATAISMLFENKMCACFLSFFRCLFTSRRDTPGGFLTGAASRAQSSRRNERVTRLPNSEDTEVESTVKNESRVWPRSYGRESV